MATGDVVGICNADDIFEADDVLTRVAEQFEERDAKGGAFDCVYGKVRFINGQAASVVDAEHRIEQLRSLPTVRRCFTKFWRRWMFRWGYMPPHPGVFIRRECFEKWGDYVPSRDEYKIAADCELLIRYFRVHKMRARYSGVCTHAMRTGGVSTKDVAAIRKLNQEIVKANQANGYFCWWPMLLPKYFVKIWEVILPRIGLDGR